MPDFLLMIRPRLHCFSWQLKLIGLLFWQVFLPIICNGQYDVVTWEPYRLLKPHQVKEDLHMVVLSLEQLKQSAQIAFDSAQLNQTIIQLTKIRDTVSQAMTELALAQLMNYVLEQMPYSLIRLSEDAELFLNSPSAETLQIAEVPYREAGSYQWRYEAMEDRRLMAVSGNINFYSKKYLQNKNVSREEAKATNHLTIFGQSALKHLGAIAFNHSALKTLNHFKDESSIENKELSPASTLRNNNEQELYLAYL